MKMKMLVSADKEFFNATSSLFRGYITPVFPSVRRGTEAVGIAYLSKSKPEIADYFQNRDKKAFRQATTSDKILPRTDPLTVELKKVIDFAAEQSHNNYISFAGRLDESLKEKNGRWCYEYTCAVHEVTQENFGLFVNVCLWTLRASGYVLSLFAQSLDLPENNEWYLRLSEFQSSIETRKVELKDIIFGNFEADEGIEVDQVTGS